MFKLIKKLVFPSIVIALIVYWYHHYYVEQEIPMYSLKCVHEEYEEVTRWYLLKRKRKDEVPSSLYDGPWMSEEFSLTSSEKQLIKIGELEQASVEIFRFNTLAGNDGKIYINRRTLKLKLASTLDYSYSCDIRNPGEFWQYVKEKLKVKKSQLKI